jgi:PAS domain S-box-containing protein
LDEGQPCVEGLEGFTFLLRASLDTIPDGILVEDPRGRVVLVNQVFCAIFGIPSETGALVGRPADELNEPIALLTARPEPFRARVRAIVERRRPVQAEPFALLDGRILERDYWPLFVTEEERGHCWRYRDVTENRRMEERMRIADRMASLGTLAAGVAHEINNPLAHLTTNLEYIREQLAKTLQSPGELEDALHESREAVDRVRDIVRDLKTLSRVEDDLRGPVDVQALLQSSINMAWAELRHRARLVRQLGTVPAVEANASRLGQVFLNLLINAAQAIPESAPQAEVRVATRTDERGRAVIEISDTGVGIPPDVLPHIFDPFFTTKPVGVGTGLGLSICHGTITGMGGEILVESRVGQGTTFRIILPATQRPITAPPAPAKPPPSSRRGRILVVDDEVLIGTALKRLLGTEHDVVAVQRAAEALELLRAESFDLVLCDLMMPEMTGMDLHAALERRDPALLEKVIYMTGGAVTSKAMAFRAAISNLTIDKPFDLTALRTLIRERIG